MRIPRTSPSRKERTYATLVHHLQESAPWFEGRLISCGKAIDESELWPDDTWPSVPLLIEHAGADHSVDLEYRDSGYGRRIRPRIYILWRYESEFRTWKELARTTTVDNEWVESFRALIAVEMRRVPSRVAPVELATRSFHRCVELLDRELAALDCEARALALGYLYEEITARVASLDSAA